MIKVSDADIGYRSAYLAQGPDQPATCTEATAYGAERDGDVLSQAGEDALCAPVAAGRS